MTKDYYSILGISPDTDQALIKAAAQARANEINEAFHVLGDPAQRQAYDAARNSSIAANFVTAPEMAANQTSSAETTKVYRSSVQFSQGRRRQSTESDNDKTGTGISSMNGVLSKLKIEAPSSAKEIIILLLAVVFLGYIASGFFVPLNERIGSDIALDFKNLNKQQSIIK